MSPNAIPIPVTRILDCEPPAFGSPPTLPSSSALRRCVRTANPPSHRIPADTTAAAAFADMALRRVLEVIDRRRPLAQLRPLLVGSLVDSLMTHSAGGVDCAPARLRRTRAQLCGRGGTAAEIAALYTRGTRIHAIACRIEQLPAPMGPRWQVIALHLG